MVIKKHHGGIILNINLHYLKKQLSKRREEKLYEIRPIGSAIRFKRKELNLTLEEASEGICSVSYLSKLENNLIEPGDRFIDSLIDRFDLKETFEIDLERFENDKKALISMMLHEQKPDEQIKDHYICREDHQAFLIQMMYYYLSFDEVNTLKCYNYLRHDVANLKDDELAIFLIISSEILYKEHRFSEAYQLLLLITHHDESQLSISLMVMKYRLKNAFMMHKTSGITNLYPAYSHILIDLEFYDLLKKIKNEYVSYIAYYESPKSMKQMLEKMSSLTDEEKEFAYAKTFFYQQQYDKYIKLAKPYYQQSSKWLTLYLMALDHLNKKDEIVSVITQIGQNQSLCLSSKILILHLKHKYISDKQVLLNYLRRDIIGLKHVTDDYQVLDYLMFDTQQLFAKNQFYKEAVQTTSYFLPKLKTLKQAEKSI